MEGELTMFKVISEWPMRIKSLKVCTIERLVLLRTTAPTDKNLHSPELDAVTEKPARVIDARLKTYWVRLALERSRRSYGRCEEVVQGEDW
jgi:hypothetical protein